MRCKLLICVIGMLLTATPASWAAQGEALYKKKCAGCHGAGGEGTRAVKAPVLKGTALDLNQLVEQITKGEATRKAPHNKGITGLNSTDAKAIAEYIKTLN